jgi:hypothetical protein
MDIEKKMDGAAQSALHSSNRSGPPNQSALQLTLRDAKLFENCCLHHWNRVCEDCKSKKDIYNSDRVNNG